MSTNFSIIGGDLRIIKLAKMLAEDGNNVYTYGMEKAEELKENKNIIMCNKLQETVKKSEIIIGPIPFSSNGNTINMPFSDKEITIKSVFRYRHIYPLAIQAVAEGKVNLKGIVTNVFELDDIQNAMDRSVNEKADIVKSVVKIC